MSEQLVYEAGGPLGASGEPGRRVFTTAIPVRWSDQDLYHHVNHARMITLLEEARIPWLFEEGTPTATLTAGAVMTDLAVKYRGQIKHADGPIRVRMWCEKVGAAMFVARHEVRARTTPDSAPAAVDCTATIAAFDLSTQRPRRFTRAEREYLMRFRHEDPA
ncbi:acyl-CoA thioesterase [Dietzia sp. CQ4]|uniref:thioesterase family protein n=1 Tax=unclassified Dietzia TaxID=2617939 RepID=UPI0015FCF6EE|nr:acyl-CoA thioesterase [Dietzia sp. CQ4]MBB1040337.1 acyl-CoA thioesterase [Dietzia sp. Cai40]MBB1043252.1 acyl-CoA thioesterase [Dietzia sp. DQ11-44]